MCETRCGDGVKAGLEQCDDGNLVDGDGCSGSCLVEECGDGVVQVSSGEVCDDGNQIGGDGCSAGCDAVESCWTCSGEPSLCTFSANEVVDVSPFTGAYNSLAMDSVGYPHISYQDEAYGLKYAHWDGSAWQIQIVDGENAILTCLALDTADNPQISYVSVYALPNGDTASELNHAQWDGNAWHFRRLAYEECPEGQWCALSWSDLSMTLDSSDNPHIAYQDHSISALRYAFWDGVDWQIQTVRPVYAQHISLALDSIGNPHISYYAADLFYEFWDGSAWQRQTVDSTMGAGWYTSLALDVSDHPHISYRNNSERVLKYASRTGSTWQTQTVDADGNVGRYTSLALDNSGYPHIAYYDETNADLKYAFWNGNTWHVQAMDSSPDFVGQYLCIAVDGADIAHVSYYDETNRDLKYTRTACLW